MSPSPPVKSKQQQQQEDDDRDWRELAYLLFAAPAQPPDEAVVWSRPITVVHRIQRIVRSDTAWAEIMLAVTALIWGAWCSVPSLAAYAGTRAFDGFSATNMPMSMLGAALLVLGLVQIFAVGTGYRRVRALVAAISAPVWGYTGWALFHSTFVAPSFGMVLLYIAFSCYVVWSQAARAAQTLFFLRPPSPEQSEAPQPREDEHERGP